LQDLVTRSESRLRSRKSEQGGKMKPVGRLALSVVAAGTIFILGAVLQPIPAFAATSSNLILNPGAEAGAGSPTGGVVPVPDWTETTGTGFTAVKYGASGGFPTSTSPGPAKRGSNFFAGGPESDNDVAVQTISLANYVTGIKAGTGTFALTAWLGGSGSLNDSGFVELDWKKRDGDLVGTSATLGPVTASQRDDTTGLLKLTVSGDIPKGARTAYLQLSLFSATSGASYNYGFADDLKLIVKTG
jgi:hypothetical protein